MLHEMLWIAKVTTSGECDISRETGSCDLVHAGKQKAFDIHAQAACAASVYIPTISHKKPRLKVVLETQ
jgi:hypothetical protein